MARILVRDAVQEYLEELESQGISAVTIKNRKSYLGRFARACDEKATEASGRKAHAVIAKLERPCVTRFFQLVGGGAGNRNQALAALRGFLKWAVRAEYMAPRDMDRLTGGIKPLRYERKPKHYMDSRDFEDALDIAGDQHPESRAIVALALYTLIRQSEIRLLRLKDIDLASLEIRVYRQKLRRHTVIGVCPELYKELTAWLYWYADHAGYGSPAALMNDHPEWYLIPHRHTYAISRNKGRFASGPAGFRLLPDRQGSQEMEDIAHMVLDGLGVKHQQGEGMHTFRRSGARALYDTLTAQIGQDNAMLRVSALLDHDEPRVTLAYMGKHIERDRMNDWLKGNSMYGPRPGKGAGRQLKAV